MYLTDRIDFMSPKLEPFNIDSTDGNADWIKTFSWDLPTDPKELEAVFGPNWYAELSRLPAWLAAPPELKNPALVKSGSVVVFGKHLDGKHNQKRHGRGGGGVDYSESQRSGERMGTSFLPPELEESFDRNFSAGQDYFSGNAPGFQEDAKQYALDNGMSEADAEIFGLAMTRRVRDRMTAQDERWADSEERVLADIDKVRQTGLVCIATDPSSAAKILEDGEFRSQFETQTSRGLYDPNVRAVAETAMLDLHPSVLPEHRPVYGFIASDSTKATALGPSQYGNVRFVFKDNVRDRTTMTVGDSLGGKATPIPLTGDVSRRQVSDSMTLFGDGLKYYGVDEFQRQTYFEAQIGGGASISEIAEIRISRKTIYPDMDDSFVQKAQDLGIPVIFED